MHNALTPPSKNKQTYAHTHTETLTLMQANENCIPIERLLTKHSKRAVFCVCFGMRIKMGMGLVSVLDLGAMASQGWTGRMARSCGRPHESS